MTASPRKFAKRSFLTLKTRNGRNRCKNAGAQSGLASIRKEGCFFLDTQTINEIDYSMAKSVKYVNAEDVSNASGELSAMLEQLTFLCSNDEVNWGNVF